MMRGVSGDECGNLLGQEYNRPAREAGVLKKPREATLTCFIIMTRIRFVSDNDYSDAFTIGIAVMFGY
jgi:hypothetical protein